MDNEPRLEDIEDYDNLKGQKRIIVWSVVLSGIIIGLITYVAYTMSEKEEPLNVDKTFHKVPMKYNNNYK